MTVNFVAFELLTHQFSCVFFTIRHQKVLWHFYQSMWGFKIQKNSSLVCFLIDQQSCKKTHSFSVTKHLVALTGNNLKCILYPIKEEKKLNSTEPAYLRKIYVSDTKLNVSEVYFGLDVCRGLKWNFHTQLSGLLLERVDSKFYLTSEKL